MKHICHTIGFKLNEGYRGTELSENDIVVTSYYTTNNKTKKIVHCVITNACKTTPHPICKQITLNYDINDVNEYN